MVEHKHRLRTSGSLEFWRNIFIYRLFIPMATKPHSTSTTTTNNGFCFFTPNVLCSFAHSFSQFHPFGATQRNSDPLGSKVFSYHIHTTYYATTSCVYIKGCLLFTFTATRCLIHWFFFLHVPVGDQWLWNSKSHHFRSGYIDYRLL